ncbi:MAG: hypothetical protein E2O76_17190 [Caldithrix sp.]|nr:MAG: hypothetical protein E2O76_17190 [Caldithrix sp.]
MQRKSQSIICGVIIVLSIIFCISPTSAQEDCATTVAEAQSLYDVGRTADMIVRLESCLPDGIPEGAERVQAYKFLALAYIAEDQLPTAKNAIEKLLDLNENFQPDRTADPSKFVELVDEAKKVRSRGKTRKKRWLYLGGGTLLAGAVTAVIVFGVGGSSAPRLPDPPPFPADQ